MKRMLLLILLSLFCCDYLEIGARHHPQTPVPEEPVTPLLLRTCQDDARCRQWVDSVLATLTLKERIGQLLIYTIAPRRDKRNRDLLHKVVNEYKVGGLLFSGGKMADQALLTNEAQRLSAVPLMITFDGEWGLSMRLKEAPAYPRNMVLGCIVDDSLIYEYGREVARQCRELGVQVNFAPVADVNINPLNPVINNRSFGENPERVAAKVVAYASGLESGGVLSVCKHFPGHGDTEADSHQTLPLLPFNRERLDSVELYPFRKAIRTGTGGVMVGHLEVPVFEPRNGCPSSLSRNVVYDLLVRELQFRGMVFTDALSMKGAQADETLCLQALKAGNDLLLVPRRIKEEVEAVVKAVKRGEFPETMITEKCRKVLTCKYALGLHRKPFVRLSGLDARINTPGARELKRKLEQAAVTVLGNGRQLLPLDREADGVAVLTVGGKETTRPFLKQLAEYTCAAEFCLDGVKETAGCDSLLHALDGYHRIVVCLTAADLTPYLPFLSSFRPSSPLFYLCFAPGKTLRQLPQQAVETAEAVVLAHTDSEEQQQHVARVLYGDAVADGRLSAAVGTLFASGEGVTLPPRATPLSLPVEQEMDPDVLARIDTIAQEGIIRGAYPGCQVVVWKEGREIYNRAFGTHTGDAARPVSPDDAYDLASLTKTTATLLAVMKLYDSGRLNLTDKASAYLPWLRQTDKKDITISDLLYHQSGLPSTILFYQQAIDEKSYKGTLFRSQPDKTHSVRVGSNTWGNPSFRFRSGLASKERTEVHTLQVCDTLWLHGSFKQEYLRQIADAPLRDRRYRYSCVGFIVLQQVVEAITGLSMDEFLMREFYRPMGLVHTGFRPLQFLPAESVVPSSRDAFLRKGILHGYVHDESAAFQGGVSGNAGLFSTATEVARICQMLLDGGELDGHRYLGQETCRLFTTAVSDISRRGLGFDKPDTRHPQNTPCAPSASAAVYGHTGFTGTCAWIDPNHKLVYVFLSNRTWPDVWNTKLQKLDIRSRIQETVYQALTDSSAQSQATPLR